MSLDVTLTKDGAEVYSANITHNLSAMAQRVGVYEWLWLEDFFTIKARHLILPLSTAIRSMVDCYDYLQQFNPENGWGDYHGFLKFIQEYRDACERFPDADVSVSR